MANITLAGTLRDPNGDLAVGDKVRFTHKSTTGETVKSASSILTIDPTGVYSVDLEYGLVLVEYKDARSAQFENLGVATVNGTNPATTIPELLNALVPVSSAELIEFQAILADCVAAKDAAEAAAATLDLVNDLSQAYIFDTVALLKASLIVFPDGKTIKTKEFSTGNGGGAKYTKITGTGTANDTYILASTSVSQSFVLSVPIQLNAKSLGLNESNTAAQNVAIMNAAMMISGNVICPDRDELYMVDSTIGNGMMVPSNTVLTFAKGVTFKSTDNADDNYRVLWMQNVVNVRIYGGIFRGDKNTHLGTTGEGGHAVAIYGSRDIAMYGTEGHDSWGVGLALVDVEDFYGEDIFCTNGRQNCCAIVYGKNIELVRPRFTFASGTAPAAGIDIEPNNPSEPLQGIRLIDPITENNEGVGINIALRFLVDSDQDIDITIINHVDRGSLTGFWIAQLDESTTGSVDGSINYINGTTFDNKASGILVSNYASKTTPKIFIDSPTIYRPNEAQTGLASDVAGIAFDRAIAFPNTNTMGNIHVRNPTIIDNRATPRMINAVNITDFKNVGYENCIIEDPVICQGVAGGDITNVNNIIKLDSGVTFTNKFNVAPFNLTSGSKVMSSNSAYGRLTNAGATTITSFNLPGLSGSLIQSEMEFVVEEGQLMRITPVSANILPLSPVVGKYIQSTGKGNSIVLEKIADDEWIIRSIVGVWDVEP